MLAQVRDGVGVVHAFEGSLGGLEVGVDVTEECSEGRLEDVLNDVAHQVFQALEEVIKGDERALSLHVGVSESTSISLTCVATHMVYP